MVLISSLYFRVSAQTPFEINGIGGLTVFQIDQTGSTTINSDNNSNNFDLRIIDFDPGDHARIRLHNNDNSDFWDIAGGGINNSDLLFYHNQVGDLLKLSSSGTASLTSTQSVFELKTTNHVNGSVLILKNTSPSLFNYVGAINFNTISSTPGQIAYSSSNTLDFKVNSISPLMQLSNGANHIIMSNGAKLTSGGMWMDVSSRSKKNLEKHVQVTAILSALADLPIYQWRYKEEPGSLHFGPTSEEFRQIFGLGPDDQSLSPSDLAAVAIAAVQALREENKTLKEELLEMENAFMELKTVCLNKKRRKKLLKLK